MKILIALYKQLNLFEKDFLIYGLIIISALILMLRNGPWWNCEINFNISGWVERVQVESWQEEFSEKYNFA